jgi:hypothetical protein
MVFLTITKLDKDFILLETPNEQRSVSEPDLNNADRRVKKSLCEILNFLETEGFKLLSSSGSDWELIFTFTKEGTYSLAKEESKTESIFGVQKPEPKPQNPQKDRRISMVGSVRVSSVQQLLTIASNSKHPPMIVTGVDLTDLDPSNLHLRWEICQFLGCSLTPKMEETFAKRGSIVVPQPLHLPFKVYRRVLYNQAEIQSLHDKMGPFSKESNDFLLEQQKVMHDFTIREALKEYLLGKKVIGVFGGHGTRRKSPLYRNIVLITKKLAESDYTIVSGGGPGAMEVCFDELFTLGC